MPRKPVQLPPFQFVSDEIAHRQCSKCKIMYHGPATGLQPGRKIVAIDDDNLPVYSYREMVNKQVPHDTEHAISHGMCEPCYDAWYAKHQKRAERVRRQREAEQRQREAAEAAEQQRGPTEPTGEGTV